MDDSRSEQSAHELMVIPQEMLGETEAEAIHSVRRIWDATSQAWYYSIVDFVQVLTGSLA